MVGLGLVWLKMTKVLQNDQQYIEKVWSSFPCILVSVKRGSYEITAVYLPLISVVGPFNIFLQSPWLLSFLFFMKSRIIVHYCMILQLTEFNFCRKSIFAHIWAKRVPRGQNFKKNVVWDMSKNVSNNK